MTPDRAVADAMSPADVTAKAGAENFPVALRFLPRKYRDHLMAVYRYARTVDDVGDLAPPDQRPRLLSDLSADVRRLYEAGGKPVQPAVAGLATVVAQCGVLEEELADLIKANEQDQVVTRYETFEDLLGYCVLSANPVGRIVLHVFGCYTPERALLSDAICSGLQVAEHLQDVAEDMQAGRIYLPAADMAQFGCTEQDLTGSTAPPQLRRLVAFEAERTSELFATGAPLVRTLRGAARAAVAGYLAGGRAAIAAVAAADYDVLAVTPRPGKGRTIVELATAFVRGR